MRDLDAIKADIAQAKADMEEADRLVRRERSIINRLLWAAMTVAVLGIVVGVLGLITGPTEAQQRYFDTVGDRYGMSQETAEQVATLWCDSHGNPDADKLADLIRTGTDEAGFDRLAGSRTELVLLTLTAEQAYCEK